MSLGVRIMIIDQLMENCDHAEQLADRKKAEANVEEQKQLENDFINQFNLFMNNIELLYAMNNMIEIKLDTLENPSLSVAEQEKNKEEIEQLKKSKTPKDLRKAVVKLEMFV